MGISAIFKVLSDPFRRNILMMLKEGKMSAGEISRKTTLTDATVSYHLKRLRKADLIIETRCRNYIFYELNMSGLADVLDWTDGVRSI